MLTRGPTSNRGSGVIAPSDGASEDAMQSGTMTVSMMAIVIIVVSMISTSVVAHYGRVVCCTLSELFRHSDESPS